MVLMGASRLLPPRGQMADAELLSGQTDPERLSLKQTWPHLHSLHEGTINEKTLHLKKSFHHQIARK